MLSYQHSYHAGNRADVHKHIALLLLLQQLQYKDAPLCYVDTHAGRGLYDLSGTEASKTGEADTGIRCLLGSDATPAAVTDYLQRISECNNGGALRFYPGSALLAQSVLRPQDRAILLELHPQEYSTLKRAIGKDRRIAMHLRDCYEGLPALLPPPIKRGIVLIDPSYELKTEYRTIVDLINKAVARWSNAVFLLWYPLLPEQRHNAMLQRLSSLRLNNCLRNEHQWRQPDKGMHGSGLFIVNTPWQFAEHFESAMQFVSGKLNS